ncbi:MAG: YtxH domain-containing protein [Candidatus Binatia bacterium]
MFSNGESHAEMGYFLAGVGVGVILGLLFAPSSGEETREYIRERTEEGGDYLKRRAEALRKRGEEVVERGKEYIGQQQASAEEAVESAKQTYGS